MTEPLRILFCSDPGFLQHVAVVIASLQAHHPGVPLDLHLIASTRDEEAERWLRYGLAPQTTLTIHDFRTDRIARFRVDGHITLDTYLRLFAATLLPDEIDRIFYLDADQVVMADLRPLLELDLDGRALAAAPDLWGHLRLGPLGLPPDHVYVNAGLMLLNLRYWREHGLVAKLCGHVERNAAILELHDQDALNAVLHRRILVLPQRWNVQAQMFRLPRRVLGGRHAEIRAACRDPAVIHFAGPDKPWQFRKPMAGRRHYFRHLASTAWRRTTPDFQDGAQAVEYWLGRGLAHAGIDYVHLLGRAGRAIDRLRRLVVMGTG